MTTISVGKMTDTERLKELLYQSIKSHGLNPQNTFLLLATLLEKEFGEDNSEEASQRFIAFVRGTRPDGLAMDPKQLISIINDFKHPHEIPPYSDQKIIKRMAWMRKRIRRLLSGESKAWGNNRFTSDVRVVNDYSKNNRAKSGIMRRLNRDRSDLAERVAKGEMSANAAAIEAGFRKKPMKCCPNCGHKW